MCASTRSLILSILCLEVGVRVQQKKFKLVKQLESQGLAIGWLSTSTRPTCCDHDHSVNMCMLLWCLCVR